MGSLMIAIAILVVAAIAGYFLTKPDRDRLRAMSPQERRDEINRRANRRGAKR